MNHIRLVEMSIYCEECKREMHGDVLDLTNNDLTCCGKEMKVDLALTQVGSREAPSAAASR